MLRYTVFYFQPASLMYSKAMHYKNFAEIERLGDVIFYIAIEIVGVV